MGGADLKEYLFNIQLALLIKISYILYSEGNVFQQHKISHAIMAVIKNNILNYYPEVAMKDK